MRLVGSLLGLVLATVLGLLALSQFGVIQSSLEGLTTGPLRLFLGNLQFIFLLLSVLVVVFLLAGAVSLLLGRR